MLATLAEQRKPWDLSHVLELAQTLSPLHHQQDAGDNKDTHPATVEQTAAEHNKEIATKSITSATSALGDFSKIFGRFGPPAHIIPEPSLVVQWPQSSKPQIIASKAGCAPDGVIQSNTTDSAKENTPAHGGQREESDTEPVSDSSLLPDTPTLTKGQRKRQRKQKRIAEGQAKKMPQGITAEMADEMMDLGLSEPECIMQYLEREGLVEQARKAVVLKSHDLIDFEVPLKADINRMRDEDRPAAHRKMAAQVSKLMNQANGDASAAPTTLSTPTAQRKQTQHPPSTPIGRATMAPGNSGKAAFQFVPATVGPGPQQSRSIPLPLPLPSPPATMPNQSSKRDKPRHVIGPIVARSSEDRNWVLLTKLIKDFGQDRKHLISPMNLTTHNNNPEGIHVFIDASNIFIGFNDQLKRARNIPVTMQLPPADLSFDALALLIERRRPVAKRVLVGSTPWVPPFELAKAVGYECCILDKVYKARELTERQIYFRDHDQRGRFRKQAHATPAKNGGITGSGSSGSGSETNTPQFAPARMIEQGVDEILHLKILESIVDTDVPGTIVLATGDAAKAEYSDGFMAMAERALKKGWSVELVSWSKNISAMYTRGSFRSTWGADRFKIIYLDNYAEELLNM